jgi:uncharacterized membrane protein YGL010W
MRKIESLFADYAAYHQTAGNKFFHRLGIPMIMLTLLGMLERVEVVRLGTVDFDAAMLLLAAAGAYYLTLDLKLGLPMIVVSVLMYLAGSMLPLWINVTGFVLGWIFQFIGHSVYEKKQPAFLRNFVHLLIGPLWILNDVVHLVPNVPPSTAPR